MRSPKHCTNKSYNCYQQYPFSKANGTLVTYCLSQLSFLKQKNKQQSVPYTAFFYSHNQNMKYMVQILEQTIKRKFSLCVVKVSKTISLTSIGYFIVQVCHNAQTNPHLLVRLCVVGAHFRPPTCKSTSSHLCNRKILVLLQLMQQQKCPVVPKTYCYGAYLVIIQ